MVSQRWTCRRCMGDFKVKNTGSLEAIASFSQLGMALAAGAAAWIAYLVLVREANDRRELQIRNEKREVVAEVISSIEICRAKVNQINVVSVEKVPYFPDEFSRIDASIGLANVFEFSGLVDAATSYVKAIRKYRNSIVLLKRKRPKKVDKNNPLPGDYKDQRAKVSEHHSEVMLARNELFKQARLELKADISDASTDEREVSLPNEADANQ